MSLHIHKARHKRSGYLPASGSLVESVPTPTASLLAQNTAGVSDLNSTPVGIPVTDSSALDNAPTNAVQSSAPTASASSSTSSGNQISLGTAIGACVAAFIALLLAVALAIYCSKRQKQTLAHSKSRNAANDVSRKRSHLQSWKRMDDEDPAEGPEQSMKQHPSGTLGSMFRRTTSHSSGEKSSENHRESVGTMQHFAKYHPGLAAEMASRGTDAGVDGKIAVPPPAAHLIGRGLDMTPPTSWDGETVHGNSFMSLHTNLPNSMSPNMMATERSTPPATSSSMHRWESAEILHVSQVDSDFSETGEPRSPFADSASSIRSSPKGRNPFFSAQDHPIKRTLLADTHKNPFADPTSTGDSSFAIQSLIAALQEPHQADGNNRVISVQSSLYSSATVDDGESAISVAAFPYPPTQIHLR